MAIRFDGKLFARNKLDRAAGRVTEFVLRRGRPPKIVSIFPYEDHASVTYAKLKQKDAESVGIIYEAKPLSLRAPRGDWLKAVHAAARNRTVDGLLVQKPSAERFLAVLGGEYEQFSNWWSGIAESIPPAKDVDCLAPLSLFKLEQLSRQVHSSTRPAHDDLDAFIFPATAQAVIDIALDLSWNLETLRQKKIVIIGRSVIVGRPASYGFRLLGVECELISSQSDLAKILPAADVIVAASGRANLIQSTWVKPGAILIDVGAPAPEFQSDCYEKCSAWTPVPGGVGPVTRACLLENLFKLSGTQ
jgi:methylenetetrahydrofolate dehydrogenase (NADP+)/methenyltetrahydrofolate cyclohydrolase